MKLLGIDTNAKTVKGQAKGYLTGILYLAPANLSGRNVCPFASPGCKEACLNTAGRGAMSNVQKARLTKTDWYFADRQAFMAQLLKEIGALKRKAAKLGMIPCVRLNGTSDIPWDAIRVNGPDAKYDNVMQAFSDVQFYDYTKTPKQATRWARGEMPANYHITFSLSETNDGAATAVLANGGNVAVVLRDYTSAIETGEWSHDGITSPAWDADKSDLRFLDPKGGYAVLKAKGKARKDTTGFVR